MSRRKREIPKKIDSKQHKAIKYIKDETSIVIGVEPTKNIVICNSGLALGLSQEDIISTFSSYGAVTAVVMVPHKTYCFLSFAELSSAKEAFFNIHGKCTFPNCDSILVLAFAESVPDVAPLWPSLSCDNPPGLKVIEDFVSCEEEMMLLNCLKWEGSKSSTMKHRQVQHFGYEFRYGSNDVDVHSPMKKDIPKECDFLPSRLKQYEYQQHNFCPDQLTVNRYMPGQGIPPHVDTHSVFDDPILSLSLLSDIVMDFRNVDGKKVPILLPRRSLLIMSRESRYGWTHGITPRSNDIVQATQKQGLTILPRSERISFTFRKIRISQQCSCNYPTFCDVQKNDILKEQNAAIELEKTYVQEVYEEISNHFSATRYKAWPNVLAFCKSFKTGDILIDVGCGNGKYFGQHIKSIVYEIGVDSSLGLANLCAEKGFEVLNGNCLNLPFKSGVADGCLCIAVIHHLSTHERRRQAVQEISRILCKGGRALIYVWARDQRCSNVQSCYLKENREDKQPLHSHVSHQEDSSESNAESIGKGHADHGFPTKSTSVDTKVGAESSKIDSTDEDTRNFPLPVHCNRTNFQHNDVLVPWKLREKYLENVNKKHTFYRYYHMFEENELENLCSEVPEIRIVESRYDQGNWVVVLCKEF